MSERIQVTASSSEEAVHVPFMWLEPVRSIWVPTSSLMLLAASVSFSCAVVGDIGLLTTLILTQLIAHAVVWLEGRTGTQFGLDEDEIRIDRTAIWGSLGFQIVWTIGIAVSYGGGWAVAVAVKDADE